MISYKRHKNRSFNKYITLHDVFYNITSSIKLYRIWLQIITFEFAMIEPTASMPFTNKILNEKNCSLYVNAIPHFVCAFQEHSKNK